MDYLDESSVMTLGSLGAESLSQKLWSKKWQYKKYIQSGESIFKLTLIFLREMGIYYFLKQQEKDAIFLKKQPENKSSWK